MHLGPHPEWRGVHLLVSFICLRNVTNTKILLNSSLHGMSNQQEKSHFGVNYSFNMLTADKEIDFRVILLKKKNVPYVNDPERSNAFILYFVHIIWRSLCFCMRSFYFERACLIFYWLHLYVRAECRVECLLQQQYNPLHVKDLAPCCIWAQGMVLFVWVILVNLSK